MFQKKIRKEKVINLEEEGTAYGVHWVEIVNYENALNAELDIVSKICFVLLI